MRERRAADGHGHADGADHYPGYQQGDVQQVHEPQHAARGEIQHGVRKRKVAARRRALEMRERQERLREYSPPDWDDSWKE